LISPARTAAFSVLRRIELDKAFSDEVLNSSAMTRLLPADHRLMTETVYGSLRWQLLLDHLLSQVSGRPVQDLDREILIILRMSLYQLWRMDRVPDHAVVHDAVEIAKSRQMSRGATGFVNGVLRSLGRQRPWAKQGFPQDMPLWIEHSLPEWLWYRWMSRFGAETAGEYAASLNLPPRSAFRRAGILDTEASAASGLEQSEIVPGAYFLQAARDAAGYRIQDEASQLIPQILGPMRGSRIWDACAAPGGKSAILHEMCSPGGAVVSSDIRHRRIKRAAHLVSTAAASARSLALVADASGPAPFRTEFDAVLADVPCSGLGTLRRNPEIKWRLQPEDLARLAAIQLCILSAVSKQVRPGGQLLYSTCSTEPEENEEVIEHFLEQSPQFRIARPVHPPGIDAWVDNSGFLHTFPSTRLWDGFFAAIMIRLC
jgi:16S rRNA (cytosine967-C5)-methyltransferase